MSGSLARSLGGLGDAVGGTASARFSGNLEFNSGFGSAGVAYGCRAWVNFNGTGTVAIRGSGNVSSITDNNTGDYTMNFTTTMPDVNYTITGTCRFDAGSGVSNSLLNQKRNGNQSTSTCDVTTQNTSASFVDCDRVFVAVFR